MYKFVVMTKSRTQFGVKYPPGGTDYEVEIETGATSNSIKIWKAGVEGRTFKVGDTAEYDSYNLSYLGEITKITQRAVTIVAYKGSLNEKAHRLDLHKFCWRNYKFDLAKTQAENSETSMYI